MSVPILILNPASDEAFAERARALTAVSRTPEDLQARLRAYHPEAVVRARGLSGEREMWYVYRDGRWTPSQPGGGGT